jgi:hypothetical protein
MARLTKVALLFGLVLAVSPARAADEKEGKPKEKGGGAVSEALGHEIIGPRQTLAEVADYCEGAVPRMPEPKTAAEWQASADRMRAEALAHVIYRGRAAAWRDAPSRVEMLETLEGGPGYRVKKLRYETLPGLWVPALLYEPESFTGKVPVILNVNGHDGKGKAADYKQVRCINLAKKGMIALNTEWFGMGQFRDPNYAHPLINHIDLCGTSGIATHYLAMKRAIDLLLAHPHADPERLAVTGLSGGGWQTIFISAFDTRVKLTNPVAGYSSFRTRARHFSDLGDSEQTPCDLATVTDYAQMTAMMAPRAALLTFNASDNCCFASGHALAPLMEAAEPIFRLFDASDRLRSHVNTDPGTHNYLLDNRHAFYRMVGDQFFKGDTSYSPREVPSDSEVLSAEALNVPLPEGNASLHSLALDLSRSLPRSATLPTDRAAARAWRDARAARLREVVRAKRYDVAASKTGEQASGDLKVVYWRLKVGEWSVPVVELARGEPKSTTLLLGDAGRKALAKEAEELLSRGTRVLAVDPFYLGESQVAERAYLFALLLAAVGDRPLGLQASQLGAVARWTKHEHPSEPVSIVAVGPRSSTMALVAAGLEPDALAEVEAREPLGSLKELIESKRDFTRMPELFCFGLLEHFDIVQLAAVAAPRKVAFTGAGKRARKELAGLKAWYNTWGVDWEPLR